MTIEVALIGLGSWLQPAYIVVGLVIIGLAGPLEWAESHPIRASARQHVHYTIRRSDGVARLLVRQRSLPEPRASGRV